MPFACALHANVTEHLRRRCDALAEPPQFALEGRAGEALLSRTPASVDLDSDALISAPPEGDASSTVPTPRARGWRSLTRTRPSSDVPRRLRGHQCVGSDRPPAAMSDTFTLRCRCARGLDPRRPGSLSYDRFRTARPPPGTPVLVSCRRHFRSEWDSTCGFDPASEPSHPFASTPPRRRVQRRCLGAFEARSFEPPAALQRTRT